MGEITINGVSLASIVDEAKNEVIHHYLQEELKSLRKQAITHHTTKQQLRYRRAGRPSRSWDVQLGRKLTALVQSGMSITDAAVECGVRRRKARRYLRRFGTHDPSLRDVA
jgi:hypothetical protein